MASALPTILAKKNSVPIAPPNSGPNVRLIMTFKMKEKNGSIFLRIFHVFLNSSTEHTMAYSQYTPPPSTAPFVEIAHTDETVNNNIA